MKKCIDILRRLNGLMSLEMLQKSSARLFSGENPIHVGITQVVKEGIVSFSPNMRLLVLGEPDLYHSRVYNQEYAQERVRTLLKDYPATFYPDVLTAAVGDEFITSVPKSLSFSNPHKKCIAEFMREWVSAGKINIGVEWTISLGGTDELR